MSMSGSLGETFRSLSSRSLRRYLAAQQLSMVGTWLQATAAAWIVLTLSGSPLDVGISTALQFGPILVIGPYAGSLADRWPRRSIMLVTQAAAAADVGALAALTALHDLHVAEVWVLVFFFGLLDAFDSPARQSLLSDLAGPDAITNATALSDMTGTLARMAGPTIGAALIAWRGPAACFAADAVTYVIVVAVLVSLHLPRRGPAARPPGSGTARQGLRYAWREREIAAILCLIFLTGIFGFNNQVLFSAIARIDLHSVLWFGLLNSIFAVGALAGSLTVARAASASASADARWPATAAALLGLLLSLAGLVKILPLLVAGVAGIGYAGAVLLSASAGRIQTLTREDMRGRMMALFSAGFLGTAVIGGPLSGWVTQHSVWLGLVVMGLGCIGGAAVSLLLASGWLLPRPHVTRLPG
ncbi:MAG: MFS transporter [Streptosporangiaceae bacterium]